MKLFGLDLVVNFLDPSNFSPRTIDQRSVRLGRLSVMNFQVSLERVLGDEGLATQCARVRHFLRMKTHVDLRLPVHQAITNLRSQTETGLCYSQVSSTYEVHVSSSFKAERKVAKSKTMFGQQDK